MKTKVAFFDFASCEGCQLQIANLEEAVIDVVKLIDIVSFREVMKEDSDSYDIAIVEGSIARPIDEERLKKIRGRAKVLIALGACAHLGGVQKMGNKWSAAENKQEVYSRHQGAEYIGDDNPYFNRPRHRALDELVKVDYIVPGCPINKNEFAKVLVALLTGHKPPIPDYPVCVECKKNENICVFMNGDTCMGPVTRAGCNAYCMAFNKNCGGCRGYIDHPHINAHNEVLQKYGLTPEQIMNRKTIFNSRYFEEKKK